MRSPIVKRISKALLAGALLTAVLVTGCEHRATPKRESLAAPAAKTMVANADVASRRPKASLATEGQGRTLTNAAPLQIVPAVGRVVAVGDLHGDLESTRKALRVAGAIDGADRWIGKELTLVQTGDVLDRGDDEKEIYELLWKLKRESTKAGGQVVLLNGNHEMMNGAGDMRYVTENGFEDFADVDASTLGEARNRVPTLAQGRVAAFLPGGPWALKIAANPIIAQIGTTLFAHGGVRSQHVRYGLSTLNRQATSWLLGAEPTTPPALSDAESPVWTRRYGEPQPSKAVCQELAQVLAAVGAERMVVGHTVQQKGVRSGCDGKLWRIDVGLASYYGANPIEVLQIDQSNVKVLGR